MYTFNDSAKVQALPHFTASSIDVKVDDAKKVDQRLKEEIEWLPIMNRPRVKKPGRQYFSGLDFLNY